MSMVSTRRRFLAIGAIAAVSGCLGGGGDGAGDSTERSPRTSEEHRTTSSTAAETAVPTTAGTTVTTTDHTETTATRGAVIPTASERLPLPMSPTKLRKNAQPGGPPKDGIPSIDDPAFVGPDEAGFLADGDPVFGVVRGGTAKAYPQKILVHHEIVNDELAGQNVAVTYCPLTGTVQGFHRGGTTFGVSGRLINNNLVMYDRANETWWPQILATSIPGPWNEDPDIRSLREFRLVWTTWKRWRDRHANTRVLSTDTGYARNYGRDPYGSYNPRGGYYANDSLLFPPLSKNDRFRRKRVVMGARTPAGAAAFLKDSLRKQGVMSGTIGEDPVIAVYAPGLDTAYVYRNPDERSYEAGPDGITSPDGTTYRPDSLPLSRIHTFDAMWFAWAGFYPETNVYA